MMGWWKLVSLSLAACAVVLAGRHGSAAAPTSGPHAGAVSTPPAPKLSVKPWRILGTGKADSHPQSINPPDGIVFTRDGLLLATDAKNHRVQVFDPLAGKHLGCFGSPDTMSGEIVAIAVAPDGRVVVSDTTANRAYVFVRKDPGRPVFVPAGPPILGGTGFKRLTSVDYDWAGRLYAVDGLAGVVRRYLPGLARDRDWTFEIRRPDGGPMLSQPDGIAIHRASGTVFVSSERDGMVRAYDARDGRWRGETVGRRADSVSGAPIGESVFSRSVEGLEILGDYLLAVDEGFSKAEEGPTGHLLVFRLGDPALYETDAESCRRRMAAGKPAGLVGWLGDYLSPDGVAAFAGRRGREPLVAVADQGHYCVVVYRGTDLIRAIHAAEAREGR